MRSSYLWAGRRLDRPASQPTVKYAAADRNIKVIGWNRPMSGLLQGRDGTRAAGWCQQVGLFCRRCCGLAQIGEHTFEVCRHYVDEVHHRVDRTRMCPRIKGHLRYTALRSASPGRVPGRCAGSQENMLNAEEAVSGKSFIACD